MKHAYLYPVKLVFERSHCILEVADGFKSGGVFCAPCNSSRLLGARVKTGLLGWIKHPDCPHSLVSTSGHGVNAATWRV